MIPTVRRIEGALIGRMSSSGLGGIASRGSTVTAMPFATKQTAMLTRWTS
jgi:hypothetical protein